MQDKDQEQGRGYGYGDRPVTQEEREWVAKYLKVPLEDLEDKVVAAVIDSNL